MEAGVFIIGGACWQEEVLPPVAFIEPDDISELSGSPVVYIVSETTAILTGNKCPAGLARIRQAMRGRLASCPMVLN